MSISSFTNWMDEEFTPLSPKQENVPVAAKQEAPKPIQAIQAVPLEAIVPPVELTPQPVPQAPKVDPETSVHKHVSEPRSTARVSASDKRVINGTTDVNQLVPFKYKWAWSMYLDGCANHWMPQEIDLKADISAWQDQSGLDDRQKTMIKQVFGFLMSNSWGPANSLVLSVYRHITAPECRQYLLRMSFEKGVQVQTYQHVIDTLGLGQYDPIDSSDLLSCNAKFVESFSSHQNLLLDPRFRTGEPDLDRDFLISMISFCLVQQGVVFSNCFAQIFNLARQSVMPGLVDAFQRIQRDQNMHCEFAADLINTIKLENPHLWTEELKASLVQVFKKAVEIEEAFASESAGSLFIHPGEAVEFAKFMANKRANQIGLGNIYQNVRNPLKWLNDYVDVDSEPVKKGELVQNTGGGVLSFDD